MSSKQNKQLRTIIMTKVQGCAIYKVEIDNLMTSFFDPLEGEIAQRIKMLPVYINVNEAVQTYEFFNNTDYPMDIKSKSLATDVIKIFYEKITVFTLLPQECIKFTIYVDYGAPETNVFYRTVETVILKEDNTLEIIPLKPYTQEQILKDAHKILKLQSY